MDVHSVMGALPEIVAAGSALGVAGRWAKGRLAASAERMRNIDESLSVLPRLVEAVERLEREVSFNGGTSMKDAVMRADARLHAFIDISPVARFETNATGGLIWANSAFLECARMLLEDALGNGWLNMAAPASRASLHDEWKSAVAHERVFRTIVDCDGSGGGSVLFVAHPVRVNGRITGYVGKLETVLAARAYSPPLVAQEAPSGP